MQFCKMMRTRIKRTVHKLTCQVLEEHLHSTLDSRRSTGKWRRWMLYVLCFVVHHPWEQRRPFVRNYHRDGWPGRGRGCKWRNRQNWREFIVEIRTLAPTNTRYTQKKREVIIMIFLVAFSVGKQNFGLVDHGFARSTIRYETCNKIGCEIIFSAGLVLAVTEPVEFSFGEWFSNEAQYPPVVL